MDQHNFEGHHKGFPKGSTQTSGNLGKACKYALPPGTVEGGELKILYFRDIKKRYGVSRSTIFRLLQKNQFLKPRKLGNRNCWVQDQLDKFFETLPHANEVKPKLKILPSAEIEPSRLQARSKPAAPIHSKGETVPKALRG